MHEFCRKYSHEKKAMATTFAFVNTLIFQCARCITPAIEPVLPVYRGLYLRGKKPAGNKALERFDDLLSIGLLL